jgi:hypothetical protein
MWIGELDAFERQYDARKQAAPIVAAKRTGRDSESHVAASKRAKK